MNLNQYLKLAGVSRPLAFGDFIEITLPPDPEGNPGVPRDYQVTGLNQSLRNHWYGLWDDPGLGKTVMSQAWSIYWVSEGYKTIVVTLSTLIGQYLDDFLETFPGIQRYMKIERYDYGPAKRAKLEAEWDENKSWPDVLIMTYEGWANLFKEKCPTSYPTWFYDRGYRAMVADEVHKKLCNVDTTLHRRIRAWRDNGSVRPLLPPNNETVFLPMTGTPIPRTLTDSYGIIELVNPEQYVGFKHFEREHCQFKTVKLKEPIQTKRGLVKQVKQLVGYRNHGKVNDLLFARGRRVVKDQVLDLAKPNIRRVKVQLSDEHYRLYAKLLKERYLELGDELILANNQQQLRQHALQLVSCPEMFLTQEQLQEGFRNAVMEAVLAWLEEADLESQKVILFFNRRESIKRYGAALEQYNPAFLYGDTGDSAAKDKQRLKILHDDSCRILIANPRSAGAGLNMQKVSHNVLFVEPTGVYGDFKQGLERVLRSGQEHVVDVGVIDALRTASRKAIQNMLTAEMDIERAVVDRTNLLKDLALS